MGLPEVKYHADCTAVELGYSHSFEQPVLYRDVVFEVFPYTGRLKV